MVSHSGLESVVKFHFIQTATTICYCGKEMEEIIDNRSGDEGRGLTRAWNRRRGECRMSCSVLTGTLSVTPAEAWS